MYGLGQPYMFARYGFVLLGEEASSSALLRLRVQQLEQSEQDNQAQLLRLAKDKGVCVCHTTHILRNVQDAWKV
jgi:hypothetical protein